MTYSPETYSRNKAAINAAKKRYYEKNKESILQKQRAYDRAHSDEKKQKYKTRKLEKSNEPVEESLE